MNELHLFAGAGEEYSAAYFSDIPPSVLSKLNLTPEKSYCKDSATESCPSSQFGTILEPSTASLGEGLSMLSAVGSHVKILAQQGGGQESKAKSQAFGEKCGVWFARFDPEKSLWKTPQCSLLEDLELFSETWPRWGMMQGGECFLLAQLEPNTSEIGYSFLPTPTKHNSKEGAYPAEYTRNTPTLATHAGGKINPDWTEWLMGWPRKWTDLQPLGTDKFQAWLSLHGKPCRESFKTSRGTTAASMEGK